MTTPGWYTDPLNRYEMRFWDGQSWTANVHANGAQLIDPEFGGSQTAQVSRHAAASSAPLAAAPGTTQPASQSIARLLNSMGADARARTTPSLATTLHGLGGSLVAIALIALLVGDDGSEGTVAVIAALIIGAAIALRLRLSSVYAVSSATIGAVVISIPLFALGIGLGDDADNPFAVWLIATILYLAAWMLPGFKGKTVLLGLGLFALVGTIGSISGPVDCDTVEDYSDWERLCSEDGILGTYAREVGRQGIIFLIGAAALLVSVWFLDRRGYRGTATGFIAAAMAAAGAGTTALVLNLDGAGGPLLVAIIGALVCYVGSAGERRATTWWGAALAASGTVAFLSVSLGIEDPSDIGIVALISAAVLIFAPLAARAIATAQSNP